MKVRSGPWVLEVAMGMNKRTLDTLGGLGSILAGLGCVGMALIHDPAEQMYAVWLGVSVLLVANGILMLVHAQRKGGVPGLAKDMLQPLKVEPKPVEHRARG
jgi:hypothetical protein